MEKYKDGTTMIEVFTYDPKEGMKAKVTARGTVRRKVREGKTYRASINGERVVVQDPHFKCYVIVEKAPADIDTKGYE